MALTEEDRYGYRRLLGLVGDVMGLLDLQEFRPGVLAALREVIPSDWASLNELTGDEVVAVIVDPPLTPKWVGVFEQLGHQNPLYQWYVRTQDGRARRFTDVVSREELEATALYQRFYKPLGINDQIAFTLPSERGRVIAIALSRKGRPYTGAETRFLNEARPYLIQAYRNALDRANVANGQAGRLRGGLTEAGLTEREAEVMAAVALGASSASVADQLGISRRTAEKHLQRGYRKLGVRDRSAAAARAWEIAGGSA